METTKVMFDEVGCDWCITVTITDAPRETVEQMVDMLNAALASVGETGRVKISE